MKRFYKTVAVESRDAGHHILLDGKPVRTPAGNLLAAPTAALAECIAEEWRGQGGRIRPLTMPMTQLLNTALDRLSQATHRAAATAEIWAYAATDLVCFRAVEPPNLVQRQTEAWQPLLDWLAERHGARLIVTDAIRAPAQPPEALARVAALVARTEAVPLAGLHLATGLLGSVVIALALAEGRLDAEEAWRAAHVDDIFQIEIWGDDAEAQARLDRARADIAAAGEYLRLVRA